MSEVTIVVGAARGSGRAPRGGSQAPRRPSVRPEAAAIRVRPNLDLITSNETLAAAELYLAGRQNRDRILQDRLASAFDAYDIVLLDCSPSLSLMNQNALVASEGIHASPHEQLIRQPSPPSLSAATADCTSRAPFSALLRASRQNSSPPIL